MVYTPQQTHTPRMATPRERESSQPGRGERGISPEREGGMAAEGTAEPRAAGGRAGGRKATGAAPRL